MSRETLISTPASRMEPAMCSDLLSYSPEISLQELIRLTAQICEAPMACVTLVAGESLSFYSRVGFDLEQTSLADSFCAHTMQQGKVFVVENVEENQQLAENFLVRGSAGVRAYAGAPLVMQDGSSVGTLCVFDRKSRTFDSLQRQTVGILARQVVANLELQRALREIRDRKSFVDAIEQSEMRYRSLLHGLSSVAVQGFNSDGIIHYWNEASEKLYGFSVEEAIGRNILDLVIPQVLKDDVRASIQQMIHTGEAIAPSELSLLHKDGHLVTVFSNQVIVNIPNHPPEFFCFDIDLTARKQAEAALIQSEERFQYVLDATRDGIWDWNIQTNEVYYSPQWIRLLGYDPEEVVPDTTFFLSLVHPEDVAGVRQKISDHLAGRSPVKENEVRLKVKGGSYRWFLDRGKVVARDRDGNPLRMAGTITDIAERKRTEARMNRLIQSNAQGVLFWNRKGEVLHANDAYLQIVGHSRDDLENGRVNWIHLTAPEYLTEDQKLLEKLTTSGICPPHEKEYLRSDGTRVPVLVGAAIFEDSPDEGVSFVLDLTERKKLEQQFFRAQRMESIGTLAGGIAHDLNNALAPIILSLEYLKKRFSDPDSLALIEIISTSARHGAEMVKQVLSFSRGMEPQKSILQIGDIIREVEKISNETFLKHVVIETSIDTNLQTLVGDATQIHQVLLNLSVNARDAMPHGGRLTFSAENVLLDARQDADENPVHPGPYVLIKVEDTGIGMAPEVLDKIFEPFFTTKEFGLGTGLGLSTSHAIIKSHGGFMRVFSKVNQGSRFDIYLPAQVTSGALEDKIPPPTTIGSGQVILVVDDEDSIRQITGITLESNGYRTLSARNGEEALAIYDQRKSEICLVLTDMMMPVMDGAATIRELRKISPHLPIVASSGLSFEAIANDSDTLNIRHFLPKPYTTKALLEILEAALTG